MAVDRGPPPPPPPPPLDDDRRRRPPLFWFLGVAAAAAIGVVGLVVSSGGDPAPPGVTTTTASAASTTAGTSTTASAAATATTSGTAGSTPTATTPPGIDATLGWHPIDGAQFERPGSQFMTDVAVFGGTLIAVGAATTPMTPGTAIPLPDGGGPITVGDWQISVTDVDLDAAAVIAAADDQNVPPPDGVRYVMVTMEVTNASSDDTGNVWADVDPIITTLEGERLARESWCGRLPDALRSGPIDPGQTNTGTTCFAMPDAWADNPMILAFVPEGTPLGDQDGAVWTSSDGLTWEAVDAAAVGGEGAQIITHLVEFDGALYAFGSDERDDVDAALWRSIDGRSWERVAVAAFGGEGDQQILEVFTIGDTLFAAGSTRIAIGAGEDRTDWDADLMTWMRGFVHDRGSLWRSSDGSTWEAVDLGNDRSRLGPIFAAATHGPTTTLFASDIDGELALLSSTDATAWSPVPIDTAGAEYWRFSTAAWGAGRLRVVGTGAMSSPDGTTWTLDGWLSTADLAPAGEGLIGVGTAGGFSITGPLREDNRTPSLTYLDPEGAWHTVAQSGLVREGASGHMDAIAVFGDRYVAVGATSDGASEDAAVWMGGAPEGSSTVTMNRREPVEPTPPVDPPQIPGGDIIGWNGSAWSVVSRAPVFTDEQVDEFDRGMYPVGVVALEDGTIWTATRGTGAYRLDGGVWHRFGITDGLPSRSIGTIAQDGRGQVWVGTQAGPAFFDGSRWVKRLPPRSVPEPAVTSLEAGVDGTIWVGTPSGLANIDGTDVTVFTTADGLPSSVIADIHPTAGGVWVTTAAGLASWNGENWTSFTEPRFRPYFNSWPVSSPLVDSLWFSPKWDDPDELRTDYLRLDPDGTTTRLMTQHSYKAATVTHDGTVFVGTELSGLYVLGAQTRRTTEIEGVSLLRIGELWTSPDGTVWMDAAAGLFRFHPDGFVERFTAVEGLPYSITGGDRGFSDGAVGHIDFLADGTAVAVVYQQGS